MDLLQETLAFGGEGVMLHHDKRRHKQCKILYLFLIF